MNLYMEMYLIFFNKISGLIDDLQKIQSESEELFLLYEEKLGDKDKKIN